MEKKKWYKSKTLWVNLIAIGALFLSNSLNIELTAEETGSILAVVNLILRIVTKTGLEA